MKLYRVLFALILILAVPSGLGCSASPAGDDDDSSGDDDQDDDTAPDDDSDDDTGDDDATPDDDSTADDDSTPDDDTADDDDTLPDDDTTPDDDSADDDLDDDTSDDDADDDSTPDDDTADDDVDDDAVDDDTADDDTGETWFDSTSGLTWQDGPEVGSEFYALQGALDYCDGLVWGGSEDWRLPTISDLRSLIRGCEATMTGGACGVTDECPEYYGCWSPICGDPGCEMFGGPGPWGAYWPAEVTGAHLNGFWSATTVPDIAPEYAWSIDFVYAHLDYTAIAEPWAYARCVR